MGICERCSASARNKEGPVGLVAILLSLFQIGAMPAPELVSSIQLAQAATLDGSAVQNQVRTQVKHKPNRQVNNPEGLNKKVIRGKASWYGPGFHGKKTASGEVFDQRKLTAAHKTLPLGTKAKVTNLENGNTVEVQINDRGPYVGQRVIDVSHAAANALGFVESGLTLVRIELMPDEGGREEAS